MSATNKDSDEEAARASNDGGDNLDNTKDDDGRENPDDTYDGDGKKEHLQADQNPRAKIFKLALELSQKYLEVRQHYLNALESEDNYEKSMGVVLYIVAEFSIRSGTTKTESMEDPTGVCTLKKGHITLTEENKISCISFHFTGKSNIVYQKKHEVDKKVYDILQELKKGSSSEDLFPDINATKVNERLKRIMSGLTIKVFRTYNASWIMEEELDKASLDPAKRKSESKVYKEVLKKVARYLNHQRAVSSSKKQNVELLSEGMSNVALENKPSPKKNADGGVTEMEWNPRSSEMSYVDHRVVILWCKNNNIPIEELYTKKNREYFKWEIGEVEKLLKENKPIKNLSYKNKHRKYVPMN